MSEWKIISLYVSPPYLFQCTTFKNQILVNINLKKKFWVWTARVFSGGHVYSGTVFSLQIWFKIKTIKKLSLSSSSTAYSSDTYHAGQWSPAVTRGLSGPPEAPLALLSSLVSASVSPVAAHPFGEVSIVVIVVVHDDGREQTQRQLGGRGVWSSRWGSWRENSEVPTRTQGEWKGAPRLWRRADDLISELV